jgi:ribosomal protein L21E
MNFKVGDRVRIVADTPHKVGTETISLRGYTGVVKAIEEYGDRVIVASVAFIPSAVRRYRTRSPSPL